MIVKIEKFGRMAIKLVLLAILIIAIPSCTEDPKEEEAQCEAGELGCACAAGGECLPTDDEGNPMICSGDNICVIDDCGSDCDDVDVTEDGEIQEIEEEIDEEIEEEIEEEVEEIQELGSLGDDCAENEECESDLCFTGEGDDAGYCSETCDDECPDGWLCYLDESDDQAESLCLPEDLCIDADEDSYGYGPACESTDCDDEDENTNPGATEVCNGADDNCDGNIDQDEDGNPLVSTCYDGQPDTVDIGPCLEGTQTCEAGEYGDCVGQILPSDEECDEIDNNCDGTVDEEVENCCISGDTRACGTSEGDCEEGEQTCAGSGEWGDCEGGTDPSDEICDGSDNNCDGQIDEELGETTCGLGVCEHTSANCIDGQTAECDPLEGSVDEICDGVDNDCDGTVDNMEQITCGLGACEHSVDACIEGEEQECNPYQGMSDEECDGVDNDCDGEIDNNLGVVRCGIGPCVHTEPSCVDGQEAVCDPFAGAETETCDEVDNDCDGEVDEEAGEPCGLGVCEHPIECDASCDDPFEGASDEVCDGEDNDCDGDIDEETELVCGLGICERTVECSEGCDDPLEGASDEICDGLDNDCDGEIDEELEEQCILGPDGVNLPGSSCQDILDDGYSTGDGIYWLDPNGEESEDGFMAFCDMTNGGWTLAARVTGGGDTFFAPFSTHWSSDSNFGEDQDSLTDSGTMKSLAWSTIPGDILRVCYQGSNTGCASFTHERNWTLSQIFGHSERTDTRDEWTWTSLAEAFGVEDVGTANAYYCGLNIAWADDHNCDTITSADSRTDGSDGAVMRVGCIGDNTNNGLGGCAGGPDDYALGIGVTSCRDGGSCTNVGSGNDDYNNHHIMGGAWNSTGAYVDSTSYLYVKRCTEEECPNPDGVNLPSSSCRDILADGFSTGDGIYWLDPNGEDSEDSFMAYCDMTTDGGGWTRVFYEDTREDEFFEVGQTDVNVDDPEANIYAIFSELELFRVNGQFEFLMRWPEHTTFDDYQQWIQTSNPATDEEGALPMGYEGIHIPYTTRGWGGLQRSLNSNSSLINGTLMPLENWFYSVGTTHCWGDQESGCQPGPSEGAHIVELLVRGSDEYETLDTYIIGNLEEDYPGRWVDGTYAASCMEYLNPPESYAYAGATGDGYYTIDPDGDGDQTAFAVYCDMTTDEGGWTLVARVSGGGDTFFAPYSTHWSNDSNFGEGQASVADSGTMKSLAWSTIPNDILRVCYQGPTASCARFTHDKSWTLSQIFGHSERTDITDEWTWTSLAEAFGVTDVGSAAAYYCGLNVAWENNGNCDSITSADSRTDGNTGDVMRVGCIGDNTNSGLGGCGGGPDDFALGIGVTSCRDGGGCTNVGSGNDDFNNHHIRGGNWQTDGGYVDSTSYLYVR